MTRSKPPSKSAVTLIILVLLIGGIIAYLKRDSIKSYISRGKEQSRIIARDILDELNQEGQLLYKSNGTWNPFDGAAIRRLTWTRDDAFLADAVKWEQIDYGIEFGEVYLRRASNPLPIKLIVLLINPSDYEFKMLLDEHNINTRKTAKQWADVSGALIAVNGGFFTDNGPLGLVIHNGEILNESAQGYPGHFILTRLLRRPHIVVSSAFIPLGVLEGFQSFPAIMSDGKIYWHLHQPTYHLNISAIDRRSAIAITHDGRVMIAVTDPPVMGLSYAELSLVLAALGARDALGLDGGGSTQLLINLPQKQLYISGMDSIPVAIGIFKR